MHAGTQTIYVLIGTFMFWHKWSGGTIYDNISGPARPIMSNINGPPTTYGQTIYVVTGQMALGMYLFHPLFAKFQKQKTTSIDYIKNHNVLLTSIHTSKSL